MSFIVLIPSRLKSTRLPNKPLIKIGNKTLLSRVFERAILSDAKKVYVVTDHKSIETHCKEINAQCVMTNNNHLTGTDRLAEAAEILNLDNEEIVVNLQGDEPFSDPKDINKVANIILQNKEESMGTLYTNIDNDHDLIDKNKVKILVNNSSKVISFSRIKPVNIPSNIKLGIHIGIYSYKVSFLKYFTNLERTQNEISENLEQLRLMDNNKNIYADLSKNLVHLGIDTQEDIDLAEVLIKDHGF